MLIWPLINIEIMMTEVLMIITIKIMIIKITMIKQQMICIAVLIGNDNERCIETPWSTAEADN